MRSNYEEKRANRQERYERLALRFKHESDSRYKRFHDLLGVIPMGQPILVGHHSEKGHRALLNKADNNMRKSIEAGEKSAYYAGRAETIKNNHAISSDDPNSLERLKEKLEGLQKNQEIMKACNKIIKSTKLTEDQKVRKLVVEGLLPEKLAIEILKPDYCGRIGFPSFKLTNNNANISTVKKRIEKLEAMENAENKEKVFGDIKILENADENRVQIFFPGKPSDEIRSQLKRRGYRWSPMNGCWQAFYSNYAKWSAEEIVKLATT